LMQRILLRDGVCILGLSAYGFSNDAQAEGLQHDPTSEYR
jgi:hypothetical protein